MSVPIATFNAAELLVDRAIASVRAQTYDRWEIVVVGDGCTDDTATRVAQLGDPRIRFVNLPFRTVYPDNPHERWLVSGAAPWNHAVELSKGEWIAPLDDDDELLPNHMETLLDLALERRAEYAYGKLEQVAEPGAGPYLFSFPPEAGAGRHGAEHIPPWVELLRVGHLLVGDGRTGRLERHQEDAGSRGAHGSHRGACRPVLPLEGKACVTPSGRLSHRSSIDAGPWLPTTLAANFAGKRVLVTGGLGFIGSNLARALVTAGSRLMLVDSLMSTHGGTPPTSRNRTRRGR